MLVLVDTVPVSVNKAEVWLHLGFCGNVSPGTAARASPQFGRIPREEPSREVWQTIVNVQHLYLFYCFTIV